MEIYELTDKIESIDDRTRALEIALATLCQQTGNIEKSVSSIASSVSDFVKNQQDQANRIWEKLENHETRISISESHDHFEECPNRIAIASHGSQIKWLWGVIGTVAGGACVVAWEWLKPRLGM